MPSVVSGVAGAGAVDEFLEVSAIDGLDARTGGGLSVANGADVAVV